MASQVKVEKLKELTSDIKDKSLVFVEYDGINVQDITDIRNDLRKEGGRLQVIKNTLALRALKNNNMEVDESIFTGMIATGIFRNEDFINSSKVFLKAEKGEKVTIKGGFFEGNELDPAQIKKYASIMSQEELYSVLVGCLQGVVANLVYVLDDVGKVKESDSQQGEAKQSETKESDPKLEEETKKETKGETAEVKEEAVEEDKTKEDTTE